MQRLEGTPTGFQATRRNVIRMGALVGSAVIAKTVAVAAANGNENGIDYQGGIGNGFRNGNGNGNEDESGHSHCFLKGTTIRTTNGTRKIEDLGVGDLLPSIFGGILPIQWIGRYRFKKSDPSKPWVKNVLPIRIARSALGDDVPHADLFVTKTHSLLIDGVLVAAGNLVNGRTITRYEARNLDELEFFHIKLERHDVIYAEGALCETLLKVDENAANFADYVRQYGSSAPDETPCATMFRYGYRKDQIKSCFRSAISPWIDRRQPVDIIRDALEERAVTRLRPTECVPPAR